MIFTARNLSIESSLDLDVKIVGLAEHSTGDPGECLLFQRALTFTPQDRELGMDTYAVSNRWGATSHGCVESYRVTEHVLELDLTAGGARDLGVSRRVEIQLALSRESVDRLRTNLQDVLVGVRRTRRTMRFDERKLLANLEALSGDKRVAFAGLCAERLIPLINDDQNAQLAAKALERLWRHLQGERMTGSETMALASALQAAIPDDDEQPWSEDIAFTENALAAAAYALDSAKDDSAQAAAWAARQVIEAIDLAVTSRLNIDPNTPGAEEMISNAQAFRRELERQQHDLEALASQSEPDQLQLLRQRAHDAARDLRAV